jgi:type IV pilus assembly protein PilV
MNRQPNRQAQQGAAMMEVLVAMLIVAFGVLGFVGLQARTTLSGLEGYQRSQALLLANDIAQRISANRAAAAAYVVADVGVVDPGACPTTPGAARDLCEWANLLRGAGEKQGASKLGAMQGARGCIANVGPGEYLVSVAWQGVQTTGPAPVPCGNGAYSNENLRRGLSTVVRIGTLS